MDVGGSRVDDGQETFGGEVNGTRVFIFQDVHAVEDLRDAGGEPLAARGLSVVVYFLPGVHGGIAAEEYHAGGTSLSDVHLRDGTERRVDQFECWRRGVVECLSLCVLGLVVSIGEIHGRADVSSVVNGTVGDHHRLSGFHQVRRSGGYAEQLLEHDHGVLKARSDLLERISR